MRRPLVIRLPHRSTLGSSPFRIVVDSPERQRLEKKHAKAFEVVAGKRNLKAEVEQQFREAKRGST